MSLTSIIGIRLLEKTIPEIYLSGDDVLIKELRFETPLKNQDSSKHILTKALINEFGLSIKLDQKLLDVYEIIAVPESIKMHHIMNIQNGSTKSKSFETAKNFVSYLENNWKINISFAPNLNITTPFFIDLDEDLPQNWEVQIKHLETLGFKFLKSQKLVECVEIQLPNSNGDFRPFSKEYNLKPIW